MSDKPDGYDPPRHHIHHTMLRIKQYCDGPEQANLPVDRELMHRFAFLVSKFAERADDSGKVVTVLTVIASIFAFLALSIATTSLVYQIREFNRSATAPQHVQCQTP